MADGFLGRWSQRKADVRSGKAPAEPELASRPPPLEPAAPPAQASAAPPAKLSETRDDAVPALPTLEEAQALGLNSDFKPFAARGVDPVVRNLAMKKLFTDPHFNVMDRLDIYIDDYSLPDPLSAIDLRKMASAKFLNLFDDEADEADRTLATDTPLPVSSPDADPDLQLQQDPAPQPPSSGERTE